MAARAAQRIAACVAVVAIGAGFGRAAEEKLVPLKPVFRVTEGRTVRLDGASFAYFDPRRREVYVCLPAAHYIVVFDEMGTPVHEIRLRARDPNTGKLVDSRPTSVAVDSRGRMVLLDASTPRMVQVRNYRGDIERVIDLVETTGIPPEKLTPVGLAIDSEDNIYIGNQGGPEILVFGADWTLQERFGSAGDEPGLFRTIRNIFVPRPGVVYVLQSNGIAVQVFTPEDRPELSFGAHDYGRPSFSLPSGILATPTGEILVGDRLQHFVKVFDKRGEFAYQFGGMGSSLGRFRHPVSVTGDGDRMVYVLDSLGLSGFEVVAPIGKLTTREELRAQAR